jgi:hypothetical protein
MPVDGREAQCEVGWFLGGHVLVFVSVGNLASKSLMEPTLPANERERRRELGL